MSWILVFCLVAEVCRAFEHPLTDAGLLTFSLCVVADMVQLYIALDKKR